MYVLFCCVIKRIIYSLLRLFRNRNNLNLYIMENNKQSLYLFYNGMGGKEFFTAGSDEKAKAFIIENKGWESYFTVLRTTLEVNATREYFISEHKLFNGIEI